MLHFPPELLHQVITLTLGQYLSDVLLAPESTRSWDAIGTLLHVNHCFRCCTLRVLSPLWDGTFVERKSGYPCNYKPSIEYLRSLAELAKSDPRGILPACDVPSMRKITVPYERLGRSFAFHMARANACALHQPEMPLPWDMSDFAQGYTALPRELRECMFGRVADYAVQNLLVWMRVVVFEELVTNTEKLLFFIDPVTFSIDDFVAHAKCRAEADLCAARRYSQGVQNVMKALDREQAGTECAVLGKDSAGQRRFKSLVLSIHDFRTRDETREEICRMWISALATLLPPHEREAYGIIESEIDI